MIVISRAVRQSLTWVVILAATVFSTGLGAASKSDERVPSRLRELTEAYEAASFWAPEEVSDADLVYGSIRGMLQTLDPHSYFLEPRDFTQTKEKQSGTYYGVGLVVTGRDDRVTVVTAHEGGPAQRLGVRAGDVIIEVDGASTESLGYEDVVNRLRGPKGTRVQVGIRRPSVDERIPFTITRDAISLKSVPTAIFLRPGVGYVRISDFTATTARELTEALVHLQSEGLEKLILDLRGNGGGLLRAAIEVSDHFVHQGQLVVETRGRVEGGDEKFEAPGRRAPLDLPLIVLVDHGSASASEIVAGAIQDYDLGIIAGQVSWGKGLVQTVYDLGYGAGLALTSAKYYTPSGRNIQRDFTSLYDYYGGDPSTWSRNVPDQRTSEYRTLSGREVRGGGGITPDIVLEPGEISRVIQLLEARGVIFDYGVAWAAKHPDLDEDFKVTPAMVEEMIAQAVSKDVVPVAAIRTALVDNVARVSVEHAIRSEIVAAKWGFEASYPDRIARDAMVEHALTLFPEAEKLMARVVAYRAAEARKGAMGGAR